MYKHCDLLLIIKPENRRNFEQENKTWDNITDDRTILSFNTFIISNTLGHIHHHGTYGLDLTIGAANTKPIKKTLEIALTGDWQDNEDKMLGEGITVRVL